MLKNNLFKRFSLRKKDQAEISVWQKLSLVIFGLFLILVVLEIGLRLGGFVFLSVQEYKNRISISKKSSYRIMCLGESTTMGEYPHFLEEILNQRNIGIKFSVIDKGLSGTNTSAILSGLESNLDAYHPDMVITMMGANDNGRHMPYELAFDSKELTFLKFFRTYKLIRILWLHVVTRLKELRFYKLSKHFDEINLFRTKNKLQQIVEEEDVSQSEEALKLKKAIELNSRSDWAYVELGRVYQKQSKLSEAEEACKKAIELNSRNDWAYVELGRVYYRKQFKLSEAEEVFKKAIELNSSNDWAYVELGSVYRQQNKLSKAEEAFKKVVELNPGNDWVYGALEILCIEMGNLEDAKKYGKKAKELGFNHYSSITTGNYHKFKTILDKRRITYVCAQYPIRNLEPLKKIFRGNEESIIFVNNEKIFKDAVGKYGYQKYFRDMVDGDFGHCTERGNRLLAENIANTILKEVFQK